LSPNETPLTIASTLAGLANVGSTPVVLRLDPELFPASILQDVSAPYRPTLALDRHELTVSASAEMAWCALQDFLRNLLASTQRVA
jgi:hypothetical protein